MPLRPPALEDHDREHRRARLASGSGTAASSPAVSSGARRLRSQGSESLPACVRRPAKACLAALLAALALCVAAAGCGGNGSSSSHDVVVALDFTPNAVHAPLYMAAHDGFDREHGIRIRIRTPASQPDALKLLASGRIDVGILDIHDLGLARERGRDIVGIAALVQRP